MTLGLIFKRMRREWRPLSILLLAVCLLAGFFALGPFYVRAVTDVGLRYELDSAAPEDLKISLIVENEPLTAESFEVVREELGDLAVGYRHYIRADYTPPTTQGGMDDPGLAVGGYLFRYGEVVDQDIPRTGRNYQPFAFDDMPSLLTLVEGRWPVRLPPPEAVDPTGLSDAERQERGIGIYNRGQVEVVVTSYVAQEAELELGSRWVLGTRRPDGSGSVASVVVVGIVEAKNPDDPFWQGNRMFLEGAKVPVGIADVRYDFGLATVPEAYTDWLRDVTPGNSYIYVIDTDTSTITADNTQSVNDRLQVLQSRLSAYHPGLTVLSGLATILENFSGDIDDTEGPIILLSGAILIMMLYHLINTVALVLEQQGTEWSTLVSRGSSTLQLVLMQFMTVGLIAVVGLVVGPLLSIVFMHAMENFGPLAQALGDRPLGATDIPQISLYLSAGAAFASAVVLTLPALPAARRSLLRLKQLVSRPPTRPAWARYALDVALLVIGTGFLLRLYYMVGGDFGDLLNNLIAAPKSVIELIADNLTDTGGLNDPFNLLGPALVLTGAALLWLRFFPWLMNGLSHLFRNSRRLTTPLAVWNVARDPGHYAQLVLLLIGTLALGTASLGLTETREQGAWSVGREETGGSARVEINPVQLDADDVHWARLPGVSKAVGLLHAIGVPGTSQRRDVHLFGLIPDAAADAFPELKEIAAPLRNVTLPSAPGIELPDDAAQLTVQVFSTDPRIAGDPQVSVQLTAYLQDALGVPFRVRLTAPDSVLSAGIPGTSEVQLNAAPTPTNEWLTFSGPMPSSGRLPYRLVRVGLNSQQANIDAFEHTVFLDLFATQNVFGTSTPVESFEDDTNRWTQASAANPYAAPWITDITNVHRVQGVQPTITTGDVPELDGPHVLRLDYRKGRVAGAPNEPSIMANEPAVERIPVVINRAFAQRFAGQGAYQTAADDPLAVGDIKNITLNLGPGSLEIGYVVAGVVDDIPSVPENQPVMVAHMGLIQPVVNQAAAANYFFDENEIWLELPDREPSSLLQAEIAELEGVNNVVWAWTRFGEIQREPLPSAIAGMLFAGFWISLGLSLLDFAFYLVVTAKQRLFTFAVLRSLGWDAGHIWRLLLIEQIVLITPVLVIGSLIGAGLAYLLLPFLALAGGETLHLPLGSLIGMLLVLVLSFMTLMAVAAIFLRRTSVNQVLRLGEE